MNVYTDHIELREESRRLFLIIQQLEGPQQEFLLSYLPEEEQIAVRYMLYEQARLPVTFHAKSLFSDLRMLGPQASSFLVFRVLMKRFNFRMAKRLADRLFEEGVLERTPEDRAVFKIHLPNETAPLENTLPSPLHPQT